MPPELINYITHYGYLSIFLLVFLQEIGIPSFPNELALIYFGYVAYLGDLHLLIVLLLVILADVSGTSLIYILFYFFTPFLKKHKPKWLPVPHKSIQSLKIRINNGGNWKIFAGRLIPYLRGYTSVAAGLLNIAAKQYLPMVLLSALVWSGGYVMLGWFAGPYWDLFSKKMGLMSHLILIIPIIILLYYIIKFFIKKYVLANN